MSLENLQRIGKLKAHAAAERELARLLDAAEAALRDAKLPDLGSNSRLDLAYRAIMQAAMAAMMAQGYRPATSEPGHHQLLLQALTLTAGIPAERVRVLEAYRKARNQGDYDGVPASDAMAHECVAEAGRLISEIRRRVSRPQAK